VRYELDYEYSDELPVTLAHFMGRTVQHGIGGG
jgi:hypothetical protein